jgi:hypothetical protein
LHYAQQRGLDDIVDTQAAKGDAAGLTIIESTRRSVGSGPWPRCTGR